MFLKSEKHNKITRFAQNAKTFKTSVCTFEIRAKKKKLKKKY